MKYKKVIFITNDFGFGPMSRTHTIAKALSEYDQKLEIRIATNGKTDYLFDQNTIIFDRLDDLRSQAIISRYLSDFVQKDTVVISVMNRFALLSAKELGFTTMLIDGLYWFWINRPKEYDQADFELRMVLPWQTKQHENSSNIYYFANPVDIMAEDATKNKNPGNKVLLTLNGFVTPFYKQKHDSYLKFLALIVNTLSQVNNILLTGNKNLKEKIPKFLDEKVTFKTLGKTEYIRELKSAKYVILNGGSNSFIEALVCGKDYIFSLPSNQSQYTLIRELSRYTGTKITDWCPLLELFPDHERLLNFDNEGSAIDYWSEQIRYKLREDNIKSNMGKLLNGLPEKLSRIRAYSEQLKPYAEESIKSTAEVAKTINLLIGRN